MLSRSIASFSENPHALEIDDYEQSSSVFVRLFEPAFSRYSIY